MDPNETATHVLERRRLYGRHFTKEIARSVGIVAVATFVAWVLLGAQAESNAQRTAVAREPVVALAPAPARSSAPLATASLTPPSREPPKARKPAPRPKTETAPAEPPDPLLYRSFRP